MPRSKQRYRLDIDDILTEEFLTPANANSLIGGLNDNATKPLATSAGGTGVVGKDTFQDNKLLRYNAAIDKIVNGDLSRADLETVAAGGDLTGFYPDPNIRDNAVIYDYIGSGNQVTDVLNSQVVLSVTVNAEGSGYTARAQAVIAPPNVPNGEQATVNLVNTGGAITGTTNLTGGSGYTTAPAVVVTDPGAGGAGCQILSKFNATVPDINTSPGSFSTTEILATFVNGGTGYGVAPTATVSPPASGTRATLTVVMSGNLIQSFHVSNTGTGYNATTKRPVITIQDTGTGDGAWWTAKATTGGQLSVASGFYTFGAGGSGYSANATIAVNPPGAGGSQATASLILLDGAVTGIIVTNPGSGYTSGAYFTFVITDPGAGGSGANLTTTVLQLPSTQGTTLLGAAPTGDGGYSLQWFPQPDLSFLDGQVSPVTVFDSVGPGLYQYYTIPSWASSLQVEIYGPGGIGGVGGSGSGSQDGGGGGGGSYTRLQLSTAALTAGLSTLDGQGQIKIFAGQGYTGGTANTTVQFGVIGSSTGYSFAAGGGGHGVPGNGGSPAHPAGGTGGTATYNGVTIVPGTIDANVVVSVYGIGGPGDKGAGQDGVTDPATSAHFGDGGQNGSTYLTANPALPQSATNPRYQNNSSKSDGSRGGAGLTPGNGGGGGRNGLLGGAGGNGRVIITAFVASGVGTTTRLLVPKALGLVNWSGSAATLVFNSNVTGIVYNNSTAGLVGGVSMPAYSLKVTMKVPFALPTYMVMCKLAASGATAASTLATITNVPVIIDASNFYITMNGALPNSEVLISFDAYGPE